MEIVQSSILLIAIVSMIIVTLVSIIPYIPGPIFVWGIGLITAFLTGFERVTVPSVILMSLFMLVATLQEYWLPFFGIRGEGLSCLGVVGSIIGGLVGTFLIPIPILGTITGMVIGTFVVEYTRIQEMRHALRAGKTVFKLYLWGMVVEFAFSVLIIITFILSALSTG